MATVLALAYPLAVDFAIVRLLNGKADDYAPWQLRPIQASGGWFVFLLVLLFAVTGFLIAYRHLPPSERARPRLAFWVAVFSLPVLALLPPIGIHALVFGRLGADPNEQRLDWVEEVHSPSGTTTVRVGTASGGLFSPSLYVVQVESKRTGLIQTVYREWGHNVPQSRKMVGLLSSGQFSDPVRWVSRDTFECFAPRRGGTRFEVPWYLR